MPIRGIDRAGFDFAYVVITVAARDGLAMRDVIMKPDQAGAGVLRREPGLPLWFRLGRVTGAASRLRNCRQREDDVRDEQSVAPHCGVDVCSNTLSDESFNT
jgi:hypothetical protein